MMHGFILFSLFLGWVIDFGVRRGRSRGEFKKILAGINNEYLYEYLYKSLYRRKGENIKKDNFMVK